MEADRGKFRIVEGDVRLEDPKFEREKRSAYLADIIRQAEQALRAEGLRRLTPLSIAPARRDDDYSYFLHIRSALGGADKDGAFHFEVMAREKAEPSIVAERLVSAARFYAKQSREWGKLARQVRKCFESEFSEYPEDMVLHQLAIILDENGRLKFSVEFTMLEYDLELSRARVTGQDPDDLTRQLAKAAERHRKRASARLWAKKLGSDCFIDGIAKQLIEHAGLAVERVLEVMDGTDWIDFLFEPDDHPLYGGSIWWEDGTIRADLSGKGRKWEIRGDTLILLDLDNVPETALRGAIGNPLRNLIDFEIIPRSVLVKDVKISGDFTNIEMQQELSPLRLNVKSNHIIREAA